MKQAAVPWGTCVSNLRRLGEFEVVVVVFLGFFLRMFDVSWREEQIILILRSSHF